MNQSRFSLYRSQRGAALLIMFVILMVAAATILLRALNNSNRQSGEDNKISTTVLAEASAALTGYAASRPIPSPPCLPCPDKTGGGGVGVANDGQEDRAPGGACVAQEGNFPWVTLGTAPFDAWGNRFRYRVTPAFSNSAGFTLATIGDINIQSRDSGGNLIVFAASVPAVILSHGRNGFGARNSANLANQAPTAVDEQENTNGNTTFISRVSTSATAPTGEFDDLAVWLATGTLTSRMQTAGKL